MNVLILNWRDPSHPAAGGAEGYLAEISRGFLANGHQVCWFCGRAPGQPAASNADGLRIFRAGGTYGVYARAALAYLRRFRGRVDLIVDGENGIPFFSPFYSRVPRIVLVHHVHREVFEHQLPWPLAQLGMWLEGRLMPFVYRRDWFVAVSESTRRDLLELGVSEDRLAVIHNGLDHERYRPASEKPDSRDSAPNVLWLGRLQRYKSLDTLLDAAALWHRPRPELRLRIAGEGPERSRLEERVADLGLRERVEFLGFVEGEEKTRLLQQADLVIQTSLKEGWGMTVIEANACGTPVVASDVAGLRDSVRDRETGMLVPWNDADALSQAVLSLLDSPETLETYGENAVRWARRFDWRTSAERWLELAEARLVADTIPQKLHSSTPFLSGVAP